MKKILYIIIPLALIVIVVIRLKSNKDTTKQSVFLYDKEEAIYVQADTLKYENIDADYSFTGTFEPYKETKLSAEIQGKINAIYVDAGSYVKKGQSLIQLDNSLLKFQLQSMEVQIEGLDADVKRYAILANADAIQGVQLEKAELGIKSAKVQKSTLQEQIIKTTIKAPFDGIVTAKLIEGGAFAAPGVPLLQITDISQLKFSVNIPEGDLNLFDTKHSYNVSADVYPEIILSGKATLIGSKGNVANNFPVQFNVNNTTDLRIKAGMFGKVILKEDKGEKLIIIPASSIVGSTIQPQVYMIKNRKVHLQNVSISKRIQDKVIIRTGLKEGNVIVTNGFINLFDGANVSVK